MNLSHNLLQSTTVFPLWVVHPNFFLVRYGLKLASTSLLCIMIAPLQVFQRRKVTNLPLTVAGAESNSWATEEMGI